jgi:hypothetical protein
MILRSNITFLPDAGDEHNFLSICRLCNNAISTAQISIERDDDSGGDCSIKYELIFFLRIGSILLFAVVSKLWRM